MFESWFEGLAYLLSDNLVSYYSFFTAIFAEIAFLWGFGVEGAMLYTILLVACIVNVLFVAFLKGSWFCETKERQQFLSRLYCGIYLLLFITGCLNSIKFTFALFVIPVVWTGFSVWLRGYQNSVFGLGFSKWEHVMYVISKIIQIPIVLFISELLLLVAPIGVMTYFVAQLDLALAWKIVLPVLAAILAPIWAYIEDSWATQNIFELAYEMDWW